MCENFRTPGVHRGGAQGADSGGLRGSRYELWILFLFGSHTCHFSSNFNAVSVWKSRPHLHAHRTHVQVCECAKFRTSAPCKQIFCSKLQKNLPRSCLHTHHTFCKCAKFHTHITPFASLQRCEISHIRTLQADSLLSKLQKKLPRSYSHAHHTFC